MGLLVILSSAALYGWKQLIVRPEPIHVMDLPTDYRIRTPINSPSIQPLDGRTVARLTEVGQGDYLVEHIDVVTKRAQRIDALSGTLSGLEDRGRLFLWSFSPDQRRFLAVVGSPRSPTRLVTDLESGETRTFNGPHHESDALLSNVGISWTRDSEHWMEYASSDRDRVWVFAWDRADPIAHAHAEEYSFAALGIQAIDDQRFLAPAFRDDESLGGVASYRIEPDQTLFREAGWDAPFEEPEPTESLLVEPLLNHRFAERPLWFVQSRRDGRRLVFSRSFPFVTLAPLPPSYEIWEGHQSPEAARLIWRFSDPIPRFELSTTTDGAYLQFLDQPSFWMTPTSRGPTPESSRSASEPR